MYFSTLALLLLATVTSGLQVFGDYGEVSDYKRQEGGEEGGLDHSGHWTAGGSDHEGRGHGEKLHNSHFYGGSGEVGEGGSKAGGHLKQKVTKGYQNYHHKDEVGRTTSYIDTSGDSGDHYGNYDSDRAWGSHGHGGSHRDHHASGYSGQNGLTGQKFSQKKGDYKGNIAEVIYAKKPTYYSKPYQPQVPYPYYFY
ncbi:uncharacterized protein LOC124367848 [Homalodisca vitripennis]|uniref:uncharacterized protein LOC124367848 n=1 Tax=Homalodisca vitripennis TaxID=197043 RepID=UPI001EEC9E92|nr:uncharacterized protein LOC124367848 [Homalodisca vitripennis]